jgi:hypothetical protein
MANEDINAKVVVQLDGVQIEKSVKKAGKALEDALKRAQAKADISTAGQIKVIKAREEAHKSETLLNDKMLRSRKLMSTMMRAQGGSGVGGNIMNMLQQVGGLKMANYQRLQDLKGQKSLSPDEKKEQSMLSEGTFGNKLFSTLESKFEKLFGGDSKWNKTFGGQGKTAAAGLGIGAIGGGLALSKMIIDSSPAFQQLLKMTKFATMLILRPIGDFFGFLFRPILILLLRKFIIPFYQTVYPWFVRNGKMIGETVAAVLDSGEGIKKAIEESVKITAAKVSVPLEKIVTQTAKTTAVLEKSTPEIYNPKAATVLDKASDAKIYSVAEKILPKIEKSITTSTKVLQGTVKAVKVVESVAALPTKAATKALQLTTKAVDKVAGTATTKMMAKVATKIAASSAAKFIPIVGQALLAVDVAGSVMKQFAPDQYEGVRQGALGVGRLFGDTEGTYTEHALDFLGFGKQSTAEQLLGMAQSLTGSTPQSTNLGGGRGTRGGGHQSNFAGGIIREPIFGVGKSGKTYSFGERGAEQISPIGSGSGTVINITVNGSIYSDKDMLNFQRTIMRAIETSNTRKAKL